MYFKDVRRNSSLKDKYPFGMHKTVSLDFGEKQLERVAKKRRFLKYISVALFWVRAFFTHMETSPLPVKGCKF